MSKPKSLQLFIAIALGSVILLPCYTIFIVIPMYTDFITREAAHVVEDIANQMSFHLEGVSTISRSNLTKDLIDEIEDTKKLVGLWKIKLYDTGGNIVYSTVPSEIGGRTSKDFFPDIIKTGRPHTLISKKEIISSSGGSRKIDLIETYVPINRLGRTIGVFEIYHDISHSKTAMGRLTARSSAMIYLVAVILAALIVSLSVRVAANIRRQKRTEEQLKTYANRLTSTEESERKKIAVELHDRVGQNLTALSLNLNIIKSRNGELDKIEGYLDDAFSLIEETTREIRDIMSELRPPNLDDHGLTSAIHWYAEKLARRTGLEISVDDDQLKDRPALDIELVLFRITQEALTNTVKHAGARRVEITISSKPDGRTRLAISDDGKGFAGAGQAGKNRPPRLGIVAMQERIAGLGGVLSIQSSPGRGTIITAEV